MYPFPHSVHNQSLCSLIVGCSSVSVGTGLQAIGNPFAGVILVAIQASILAVTAIHLRAIDNYKRAIGDSFGSLVDDCFPPLVIVISFATGPNNFANNLMVNHIDAVNLKIIDVHMAVGDPRFSATSYSAMALKYVNTGAHTGHNSIKSVINQRTDC